MSDKDKKQNNNESLPKCSECEEYLSGWQRAKADLINYQKDEAKRFEEIAEYSKMAVINDLLVVLDSFELALGAERDEESSLSAVEGLQKIKNQLEDTLKRHGLTKIKASPGDEFDPNFHESLGEQEDKKIEPGKISAVVGSGYKLNDKVIRPARVKLTK